VSAKDLGTGKTQHVTITGGTALEQDDIDRMINDAETYAAEDVDRKEAAEARNAADHAAHTVGSQLAEHGDKLTEDEKAPIQGNLDSMKELLATDATSTEALKTATDELLKSAQAIGEKIYEAAQAEAEAAAAEGDEGSTDDDVVEAEVVEDEEA
jgi:molecular chaperone DnaK